MKMKKKLTLKNLIILFLSVFFIIGFIRQEEAINRIEKDKQAKQEELEELQETKERLEEETENAQSDEYIEQLARERLNMIKEGETSVEITEVDSDSQQ